MQEQKVFPWFTASFSILLIAIYSVMVSISNSLQINEDLFPYFGAPEAIQIYLGQPWGVLFNSLIHVSLFHLIVNLVALWLFCGFLERKQGWLRVAIFGMACAAFSSMIQLTLSDDPGLGISAANVGFFSLIAFQSLRKQRYQINYYFFIVFVVLFIFIFFLVENEISKWEFGFESKFASIIWAFIVISSTRIKRIRPRITLLMIPFCLTCITLIYAPWSSMWQTSKGITLHEEGLLSKAKNKYEVALELNPNNSIAYDNLTLIFIEELSDLAYKAHTEGRYVQARKLYLKILALDSHNRWALTNIKKLP